MITLTACPSCHFPVHASESDDDDRCAPCAERFGRAHAPAPSSMRVAVLRADGGVVARAVFTVNERTYRVEYGPCTTKAWALRGLADALDEATRSVKAALDDADREELPALRAAHAAEIAARNPAR